MSAKVGVLALQGDVSEHSAALADLGAHPVAVRVPGDLAGVEALVLPGGESTTMSVLLESSGLFTAIEDQLRSGMPVFGTCAGMILLARDVIDGRPDQRSFSAIDIAVRRNAFGRQVDSFEADLDLCSPRFPAGLPARGVFIRAPVVDQVGDEVEVLATVEGRPVACQQGHVLVTGFHPELSDDLRFHQLFLGGC